MKKYNDKKYNDSQNNQIWHESLFQHNLRTTSLSCIIMVTIIKIYSDMTIPLK